VAARRARRPGAPLDLPELSATVPEVDYAVHRVDVVLEAPHPVPTIAWD
jgi:hypothetical protein